MEPQEHRWLREQLGAYALGDLEPDAVPALQAHLDGCGACRAELADIAPLTAELALVDIAAIDVTPSPPPGTAERLRAAVAQERVLRDARQQREARQGRTRSRHRAVLAAAAAVLVVSGSLSAGTVLGRATAPASRPVAAAPLERVALTTASGIEATTASLVPHTWGVEARFTGRGFAPGEVYRAAFRARDGQMVAAGQFLGTGDNTLTCNMQSALLRTEAAAFVVMDESGSEVLTAQL